MRTVVSRLVRALGVLGIVFTVGCATTAEEPAPTPAGGGAGAATQSTITIDNNHSSFTAMTVFLQPEAGGVRQSVGVVEAGQSRNFPMTLQRGWYTLIAQRPAGDLRSERFNVTGPSTITWDLALNRVRAVAR